MYNIFQSIQPLEKLKYISLSACVDAAGDTGRKQCGGGGVWGQSAGAGGCQPVKQELSLPENIYLLFLLQNWNILAPSGAQEFLIFVHLFWVCLELS